MIWISIIIAIIAISYAFYANRRIERIYKDVFPYYDGKFMKYQAAAKGNKESFIELTAKVDDVRREFEDLKAKMNRMEIRNINVSNQTISVKKRLERMSKELSPVEEPPIKMENEETI